MSYLLNYCPKAIVRASNLSCVSMRKAISYKRMSPHWIHRLNPCDQKIFFLNSILCVILDIKKKLIIFTKERKFSIFQGLIILYFKFHKSRAKRACHLVLFKKVDDIVKLVVNRNCNSLILFVTGLVDFRGGKGGGSQTVKRDRIDQRECMHESAL